MLIYVVILNIEYIFYLQFQICVSNIITVDYPADDCCTYRLPDYFQVVN